jgi:hypothetical protein
VRRHPRVRALRLARHHFLVLACWALACADYPVVGQLTPAECRSDWRDAGPGCLVATSCPCGDGTIQAYGCSGLPPSCADACCAHGGTCAWSPVQCNSAPYACACGNGATRLAGCGEAPTCDDACCASGGWTSCAGSAGCSGDLICAGGGALGSGCQLPGVAQSADAGCCIAGPCGALPPCP